MPDFDHNCHSYDKHDKHDNCDNCDQLPRRVVVIGDLHGHYDALVSILRKTHLIDYNHNWLGGDSCLVQMGDIFGRGTRAMYCCELLMKLQQQSRTVGGRVHCLLGNHEATATHNHLEYIPPEEMANFLDPSGSRSNSSAADAFRYAMRADQPIGNWIRNMPAVIKLGSVVFVHAGLDARWAAMGLSWLNLQSHLDMMQDCFYKDLPANSPISARSGPLWDRRLAMADDFDDQADVIQPVLRGMGAKCMVIGHTPTCCMPGCQPGSIVCKFNGALICSDVGLAPQYGCNLAWLEFIDAEPYACKPNKRRALAAGYLIGEEMLV